ncbi:MAG: undecaprenyl-diphosphate phosphatase [Azospirillaceae bacterium]
MPFLHLLVLALVQGITEFLPISSSAHLVLVPYLTGWADQGLVIDVAVHVGTLGAVLIYFWRDVLAVLVGLGRLATGRRTPGGRLALLLIVGTIPAVLAGFALHRYAPTLFRSAEVIAWATLVFGLLLWLADRAALQIRRIEHLGWSDAIIIGLAQCLAFIPGASRSGITMTAGRFLGMERAEAARFSMLLSIPTILGAGLLATLDLAEAGDVTLGLDAAIAAGLAFVSALVAIALLMAWLRRAGFAPFVVYRIALAGLLFYLLYA